ncbi:MAG: T9SS type A sorting domain-containing protein [Ignavibacteriae bacterium]|nr:T9SS type A sorting domain-containing protein [Ignavibacteriota bacterium]
MSHRFAFVVMLFGALLLGSFFTNTGTAHAQCPYLLTAYQYTGSASGYEGISFEVEALDYVKICRISPSICYLGAGNVEVWYRLGPQQAVNTGWTYAGTGYLAANCPVFVGLEEIPVDINLVLAPGEKASFVLFNDNLVVWGQPGAAVPSTWQDSRLKIVVDGYGVYGGTAGGVPAWNFVSGWKWFGAVRYAEGCNIPADAITIDATDQAGNPLAYTNPGATMYFKYSVLFPAGATSTTFDLKFFRIGGSTSVPEWTTSFTVNKQAGIPLYGSQPITLPSTLPEGYYRVDYQVTSLSTCNTPLTKPLPSNSLMLIAAGKTPCLVYPGDVNNDGIANFGDRKALNKYIFDANLAPMWLSGPARYRADAPTNPFTYYMWVGQPSVPWQTAMGCYMDSDGNGLVNNFDYIAIKLNWMKTHGTPKPGAFSRETFDMDQNYPNPFNPSTSIRYTAPEASQVTLTVSDMYGRTIATLVDGRVDAGVHTANFDATNLSSGNYVATITMTGVESGLTFTKTIKMALAK